MKRYVINLDRSEERLIHIKSIFTKQGLDFTRVKAVDGHSLSEEQFDKLTRIRKWPKKLTRAEVGCFLSHLECWRLIAEGDDPYGAVFEDDIKLSTHAHQFLKNADWVPEGCDIVKLDTAQIVCVLKKFDTELADNYKLGRLYPKLVPDDYMMKSNLSLRRLMKLCTIRNAEFSGHSISNKFFRRLLSRSDLPAPFFWNEKKPKLSNRIVNFYKKYGAN